MAAGNRILALVVVSLVAAMFLAPFPAVAGDPVAGPDAPAGACETLQEVRERWDDLRKDAPLRQIRRNVEGLADTLVDAGLGGAASARRRVRQAANFAGLRKALNELIEVCEKAPELTEPAPLVSNDVAFQQASAAKCSAARPPDPYAISEAVDLAPRIDGYSGIYIAVLEMRGTDGRVGPPPQLPPGEVYFDQFSDELRPLLATTTAQVDAVACVALRAGESATYERIQRPPDGGQVPIGEVTVVATDWIIWMVDASSGELIMQPVVLDVMLSSAIVNTADPATLLQVGDVTLLFPDPGLFFESVLGLIQPVAGAFEGNRDTTGESWSPPNDLTLPKGEHVTDSFVVLLIVLQDRRDTVDVVEVRCAPEPDTYPGYVISGKRLVVARNVSLEDGTLSVTSKDIRIEADLVLPNSFEGTIQALSMKARRCGVPDEGQWTAHREADATKKKGGGYSIEPREEF